MEKQRLKTKGTPMKQEQMDIKSYASDAEKQSRGEMESLFDAWTIPTDQRLSNIGLFLESKYLSRILFMDFLYKQTADVQGVVMEFGTRWGQNVGLFSALRGIYEPFNRHRKIIAFDTFEGFPSISKKDGQSEMMVEGQLAVPPGYDEFLDRVLTAHENLNPLSHIKKHDIRKGDAVEEVRKYLRDCPETIVALAYFDFDLYEPTKKVLEEIRPRLTKGSVIGFDELNDPDSPGETLALLETFGLGNVRLKRSQYASRVSYFVVE